jgi:hypothetical protein
MCYARMFVIRKKEAKYPNLMTSTPEEKEPKKKAYAKTKSIMCDLFHTRGKDEHASAV